MNNHLATKPDYPLSAYFVGLFLIVSLTGFYAWCGYQLPGYSAPDELTTANATRFYLQNNRLAVFPQDENIVTWTDQGGTRVMRQPFNFIFAAIVAKVTPGFEDLTSFRFSSAAVAALAMGVIFFACFTLTRSISIPLAFTVGLGFTPQIIYLASYHNDDTGALLAGAFTLLLFVILSVQRLNRRNLLFAAAVLGFILINKPTIYGVAPVICLYLLYQLIIQRYKLRLLDILLFGGVAILAGGWWVLSNMYFYGFSDPLQHNIVAQMIAEHATVENSNRSGTIQRYGEGVWTFIVNREYWHALITNSIANFGNLELRTYPFVYRFFIVQFFIGFIGILYIAVESLIKRQPRLVELLVVCCAWLAITYSLYVHFVVYVDVQFQGKYMLPVVGVLVLFSCLFVTRVGRFFAALQSKFNVAVLLFFGIGSIAVAIFCLFTTLKNYYSPDDLHIWWGQPIVITPGEIQLRDVENASLGRLGDSVEIQATSADPIIQLDPKICQKIERNALVQVDFTPETQGLLRVYYNIGKGYRNTYSKYLKYLKGRQETKVDIDFGKGNRCLELRLDPLETQGRVVLHKITITPYRFGLKFDSDI